MRRTQDPGGRGQGLSTPVTLGIAALLSLAWLWMVRDYLVSGPGWTLLADAPPTDVALVLAAVSAPLAAIWLIAGLIVNALALMRTQDAVRLTQRQTLRTSGEIGALIRTNIEMQEQARRQSFLNGVELALKDLNSQAGMITGRLGVLSADETEYLWALNAAGDPWAFCHALLARSEFEPGFADVVADRVATDEVASAGLQRFLRRYERVLALAREYDADQLVREVLEDGPLDRLHALFCDVSSRVQARVAPTGGDVAGDRDRGSAHDRGDPAVADGLIRDGGDYGEDWDPAPRYGDDRHPAVGDEWDPRGFAGGYTGPAGAAPCDPKPAGWSTARAVQRLLRLGESLAGLSGRRIGDAFGHVGSTRVLLRSRTERESR